MCRLNSWSSLLDRRATPSPKGSRWAGRPRRPLWLALQLAHDELEEQQSRFRRLHVLGEVVQDAALLLAAEGRVGHDDLDALSVADLAQRKAQAVPRIDLRRLETVQHQIHLRQQIGQRFRLAAEDALVLQDFPVLDVAALLLQMLERLDEKAAGAAGRVEDRLRQVWGPDFDHEANHGRGV